MDGLKAEEMYGRNFHGPVFIETVSQSMTEQVIQWRTEGEGDSPGKPVSTQKPRVFEV